jgi:hypothetical protein
MKKSFFFFFKPRNPDLHFFKLFFFLEQVHFRGSQLIQ